jgi:hypothetical protein
MLSNAENMTEGDDEADYDGAMEGRRVDVASSVRPQVKRRSSRESSGGRVDSA